MPAQTPMELPQALALVLCLIDWELESPAITPPPENWQGELRQARALIAEALAPITPAPYWPPNERKGQPGRHWASGSL